MTRRAMRAPASRCRRCAIPRTRYESRPASLFSARDVNADSSMRRNGSAARALIFSFNQAALIDMSRVQEAMVAEGGTRRRRSRAICRTALIMRSLFESAAPPSATCRVVCALRDVRRCVAASIFLPGVHCVKQRGYTSSASRVTGGRETVPVHTACPG